jgi:hypothetical protein
MKPVTSKKARHRNTPGKAKRIQNGKMWDALKAQTLGRSTAFSPTKLSHTISQFKNARPFKPNGKKPINRPK